MRQTITIVSGGQTGVDRAALDFAIEHNFPHGGWCPRGRRAEDRTIPARYLLQETPSRRYSLRTEWNIRDSDATVVFSITRCPAGGTALTLALARRLDKPWLHLSRDEIGAESDSDPAIIAVAAERLHSFLNSRPFQRVNIAGPRASQEPEVAEFTSQVMRQALRSKIL